MFFTSIVLPRPFGPIRTMLAASLDEAEGEDFLDERPIALGRPLPVEVGDRLEDPDARIVRAGA